MDNSSELLSSGVALRSQNLGATAEAKDVGDESMVVDTAAKKCRRTCSNRKKEKGDVDSGVNDDSEAHPKRKASALLDKDVELQTKRQRKPREGRDGGKKKLGKACKASNSSKDATASSSMGVLATALEVD